MDYLTKLNLPLAFAMQQHDRLFCVIIFEEGTSEEAILSREEIKACLESEFCQNIILSRRIETRRWEDRQCK